MIKLRRVLLYFIPLLLLLGWCLLHFVAPHIIIQPFRVNREDINLQARFEAVNINTAEGYKLAGTRRLVAQPKAVMLMLHGIGSSKEVYDGLMDILAKHNIACYAFDNRGQGKSGGKYVTFGYYEKDDLKRILNKIKSDYPDLPLGLWGNSLGGAIGLQSLATDERWDFGIIESTFAALDEIVFAYQKRITGGFGIKYLTDYALKRAGKIANFEPDSIMPGEVAKLIKVPVFHAHGDADIHISLKHARAIHKNLSHPDGQFVIVPGADHSGLGSAQGANYLNQILDFIDQSVEAKMAL